jgi:PPOX class probable FMN-dependent enzyme
MPDAHAINTVEQLRELIGEPNPVVASKVFDHINPQARSFIEHAPMAFLATSDSDGNLDVSPKGDAPGFVVVEDETTLLLPDRKGNKMALGFLNILATEQVGLIFVIPGIRETLRVNGRAQLTRDPVLLERLSAQGKPAVVCTSVTVDECFIHCGKAMIRSKLWQPATWAADFKPKVGRQLADKLGAGDDVAEQIDAALEADYEENLY